MSDVVDVTVGAELATQAAPDAVVAAGETEAKLPKRAVRNEDDTITLPFRKPVTITVKRPGAAAAAETFEGLTFHAMTGEDLSKISTVSEQSRGAALVAQSAQEALVVIVALFRRLDARDTRDAMECAGFFISDGE